MILLLGGTSETPSLAQGLAAAGYRVLLSTATDVPLEVGEHPRIRRRWGRLNEQELRELIAGSGVRAVVDSTHPYAAQVRANARRVALLLGIPYLTFVRPSRLPEGPGIQSARDHEEAALLASAAGRPVFLTIGSQNLAPYVRECRRAGLPLVARLLPRAESIGAARAAGLEEESILAERGPFPVERNREVIRSFAIGVLVMKDSGEAGGAPEKVEAARLENCRVIVVRRPAAPPPGAFAGIGDLLEALRKRVRPQSL